MPNRRRKTAPVTGASKGIGADIARELAAVGAAVVVNYAADQQGAVAFVCTITESGGRAIAVLGNFSQAADVTSTTVPLQGEASLWLCSGSVWR